MDDLFEANRPALFAVGYRMLGTTAGAEDVLRQAWLRWSRVDPAVLENPRGYLFRLVTNEAIDQLRRLRARREEYVGPWLPEPLIDDAGSGVTLAESASVGLLVVLETLTPDERAVFVLHEAFGFEHGEIAAMLGRGERAVRQLAYRARKHVQERRPRQQPTPGKHRELTERFVAAAVAGRVEALLRLLAPEAVLHADSNGRRETPRVPVRGAEAIAEWFRVSAPFWPDPMSVRTTFVNGGPGALILADGTPFLVFALELDGDGRVGELHVMMNREKLPRVARFG